MGVSTHLAQPTLETRFLGLAAPRQGGAVYPVSGIQTQSPGSWDVLCLWLARSSWSRQARERPC